MERFISDPATGEVIAVQDMLVGLPTLPPRQREAFELICLQGYTETAARDKMLPNSKSSTPVQQYADSGLVRMVDAYDAYQRGEWPPVEEPKPIKKTKRRSLVMAALHPIVRQGLEATRKKILADMEGLKVALAQVEEMLGSKSQPESAPAPEINKTTTPSGTTSVTQQAAKPDLNTVAKEMTAAAIAE